jgi:hypothetical protein
MMIGEKAADMIRGRSLADLDAHDGECRRSGGE